MRYINKRSFAQSQLGEGNPLTWSALSVWGVLSEATGSGYPYCQALERWQRNGKKRFLPSQKKKNYNLGNCFFLFLLHGWERFGVKRHKGGMYVGVGSGLGAEAYLKQCCTTFLCERPLLWRSECRIKSFEHTYFVAPECERKAAIVRAWFYPRVLPIPSPPTTHPLQPSPALPSPPKTHFGPSQPSTWQLATRIKLGGRD